ncbi:hypothetical protein K438DRAFT_1980990 [Mycena galopus ATCC 62051]|nr:hypothetical protein K438DRAFT_1980990 [Mycena galopus ATCC 62051]
MQLKLIATLALALVTQANTHLLERQENLCCIPEGYACDLVPPTTPPLIKCCPPYGCFRENTSTAAVGSKLIATLALALVTQANAHLLERQTTTECCIPENYACDVVTVIAPPLIKCCAPFACIGATTNSTLGLSASHAPNMQLKLIATLALALVTQANAYLLERQTTTECCIPGGYSCDIVTVDPPLIKCCASFECIGATTNDTVGRCRVPPP